MTFLLLYNPTLTSTIISLNAGSFQSFHTFLQLTMDYNISTPQTIQIRHLRDCESEIKHIQILLKVSLRIIKPVGT